MLLFLVLMVFLSEFVSALILAFVQGVTEWLPISSSGHLLLFETILSFDGGLFFEVALHFGTLMAVFVYFRRDIMDILRALFSGKWRSEDGKLGLLLIVGTIPAVIVGFFAHSIFDTTLSDFFLLALGFMVTGVLLLIVAFYNVKTDNKIGYGKSFTIGIAQALAILPSLSRSGTTISSGILLGLSEKNALRFSFLLSIPAILGASVLEFSTGTLSPSLIGPIIVSFITGLATIHLCFKYLLNKRKNFIWFGIYALILGIVILIWALSN